MSRDNYRQLGEDALLKKLETGGWSSVVVSTLEALTLTNSNPELSEHEGSGEEQRMVLRAVIPALERPRRTPV